MTQPELEKVDRQKDKLFVTDAELIRRIGVPEKIARATIRMLDAQRSGFPPRLRLWGDRRYWPAIVGYFDHHYGYRPMPGRFSNPGRIA